MAKMAKFCLPNDTNRDYQQLRQINHEKFLQVLRF